MKGKELLYLLVFILFLSAGLVAAYFAFQPASPKSIADEIASHLVNEIEQVDEDLGEIMLAERPDEIDREKISYPFFIYENNRLLYWSDNAYVPSPQVVSDSFNLKLIRTGSEAFILKKDKIDDKKFIVSLLLLQRKYPINNDYLTPEWNEKILSSGNVSILEPTSNIGTPVCIGESCVFRISFLPGEFSARGTLKQFALIFLGIAIVLFFVLIYQGLRLSVFRRYPEVGFFYLYFIFLGVRLLMIAAEFPVSFVRTQLFDPQVFASSSLNPSLGDMLINMIALVVLCFYIFRSYPHFFILRFRQRVSLSWIVSVISSVCILFAGLFPFVVVQTLYNNSALTLDISQSISFDVLRVVAFVIVILSGVCAFLFSHGFIRILVSGGSKLHVISSFVVGILVFSAVNTITGQQFLSSVVVTIVYVPLVYVLGLYKSLKRLSYATFAYLFTATFFFSINGAYGIQYFSHKEKIENQFRFASNFLVDRDYFGEYLLSEASRKIANDAFTQLRIANPFMGKDPVRLKIRQVFLPSYFNKYDVKIFIFNAAGDPVDNSISLPLSEVVSRYEHEDYRTIYEGIYFVNNPELDVTQKYLMVIPIKRLGNASGYIIIELSLKRIIPENVYPELLVDYSFQQYYRTHDLSYAVFLNKKIIFSSGDFNYDRFFLPDWMGLTDLYTTGITARGFDHIAVEDPNGRVAVVSAAQVPFMHKLSNFSFLFVLGLLIILLMIFVLGIYGYFRGGRLFFSARIQLYLNLAFFIPLIVVSISTLSLTSRSSQQQLDEEYLNKSKTFGQQVTAYLNENLTTRNENQVTLSNQLNDLAGLSNLDANIFNPRGTLIATSQPMIFENNLLSNYINSRAYSRIMRGENLFIESESVGKLKYFVSYAALKSTQTGKLLGILGLPFFQSGYLLEKVQLVILINILNIFAFIFIVLLVLSYFVAGWLTFPLKFITQSLRRTSLTKINSPLTWNADDEIGLMVKEYNAMLYKLSESKNELEQTQREKAWREIAQQVAHEIKNPLTPMKLTLQQLERSLQSGVNPIEKTQRAIPTLLAQVDTLNEIASSFSGFAKMPEPVIQKVEVVSLVKRSVDLHSPTGEISFKTFMKEAWVMGDAQLLSRTFSNIILNGLQSGKPGQSISVNVTIENISGLCRIVFVDNGKGIEAAIADRIFLPHFSTKKSGSGLGLAIARQAIEQMNGKIWFETKPGQGTSFFIVLPLTEQNQI